MRPILRHITLLLLALFITACDGSEQAQSRKFASEDQTAIDPDLEENKNEDFKKENDDNDEIVKPNTLGSSKEESLDEILDDFILESDADFLQDSTDAEIADELQTFILEERYPEHEDISDKEKVELVREKLIKLSTPKQPSLEKKEAEIEPVPVAEKAEPAPVKVCTLNGVDVKLNLISETNVTARAWYSGSAVYNLPVDATEIQLRIIGVHADDNRPSIKINGTTVLNFDNESSSKASSYRDGLNIDISDALKGGANQVDGRVYDRYGAYATLIPVISGSYKTSLGCP